jgi:prepilin-type N-terminal cleavage/methylation domain-containing protein
VVVHRARVDHDPNLGALSTRPRARGLQRRTARDPGFTLVEILIAIVLVGILAAVAVMGVGMVSNRASTASCQASADAATTAANSYLTGHSAYPSSMTDLTASAPGAPALLYLPSGASASSRSLVTDQWTMTMSMSSPPTFTCTTTSPSQTLALSLQSTAPTATVGTTYSLTGVTPSGGVAPYTWSATGVPPGLAIDTATGSIAGTPMTAGTFSITLMVIDAAAQSGQFAYTLTIDAAVVVPPGCPSSTAGWQAQYYSNVSLSGTATLCRDDAEINFDWSTGTPGPGLPTDNFSVRWTRTQLLAAGDYTFTVGSDDGTRLFIDGTLVVDRWVNQTYTLPLPIVRRSLTAGKHTIVLEYFENTVSARASLTWFVGTPPSCSIPPSGWLGEYYDNITLTGTQAYCRDDSSINFDWGTGSPAPSLPVDGYSVRWIRTQDFAAGDYTFTIGSDDGSRLYIDGTLVFDRWVNQGYPSVVPTVTRTLSAGSHEIVMEYYDSQFSAKATLTWYVGTTPLPASCTVAATGWLGEYYNNRFLTGTPVLCRDDGQPLNVNWSGSPATGVLSDGFSVRWSRSQTFAAGTYTFALGTDDGGRLYIDGSLVIDRWVDQGYPTVLPTAVRTLTAGAHKLVVEFYDATGGARATLTWS